MHRSHFPLRFEASLAAHVDAFMVQEVRFPKKKPSWYHAQIERGKRIKEKKGKKKKGLLPISLDENAVSIDEERETEMKRRRA